MDAPATIICRLNIDNWTTNIQIGLNISIFDANTSLEQSTSIDTTSNNNNEVKDNDTSTAPAAPATTTSPSIVSPKRMLTTCSPSNAIVSSNSGIYVIRPCGASIQAYELPAGRFLLVPSTFEPQEKRYTLEVYILSSVGYNIIKLR